MDTGFLEHLVKAIEQSMAAAFERSSAHCVSEMNRVFDYYNRRSEARKFANGEILEEYRAVHDIWDDGFYDDRRFIDERFSRENTYPRGAFRLDILESDNYPPPQSSAGMWPQTRRRSSEEEYSFDREIRRHDKPPGRYGGRERENYGYDDYEYRSRVSHQSKEEMSSLMQQKSYGFSNGGLGMMDNNMSMLNGHGTNGYLSGAIYGNSTKPLHQHLDQHRRPAMQGDGYGMVEKLVNENGLICKPENEDPPALKPEACLPLPSLELESAVDKLTLSKAVLSNSTSQVVIQSPDLPCSRAETENNNFASKLGGMHPGTALTYSSVLIFEGAKAVIEVEEKELEEDCPREQEMLYNMETVSEHIGHGSQSSEEEDSLELDQVDKYGQLGESLLEVIGRISIKAMPMSLVLEDSNSKSYLCNIIDAPGHVNFPDEMTAALRLADGVVLVVDAGEGDLVNTERAMHHAIQDRISIAVVLNKVDRLITELKLPTKDAYHKLRHTIGVINNHIAVASSTAGNVQVIDPALGNVCFASASAGWLFTLQSFAKLYVKLHGV